MYCLTIKALTLEVTAFKKKILLLFISISLKNMISLVNSKECDKNDLTKLTSLTFAVVHNPAVWSLHVLPDCVVWFPPGALVSHTIKNHESCLCP